MTFLQIKQLIKINSQKNVLLCYLSNVNDVFFAISQPNNIEFSSEFKNMEHSETIILGLFNLYQHHLISSHKSHTTKITYLCRIYLLINIK